MLSSRRFLSAIAGLMFIALPATALAADHHWDHHWAREHHGAYVTPQATYGYPLRGYRAPETGYVPGYNYPARPYAGPYASAGTGNLGYLMEKRQEAYNAIAVANRSGNTAGAHRMWEVYNTYNQRIAAMGGGAARY